MSQAAPMTQHQQAVSQYYEKRAPGDKDLIAIVRRELESAGLGLKLPAAYDNNRFIMDARDKTPVVQRHFLNRYWSLQIMSSPKPSTEERFCLINDGTVEEWIVLFKAKILPFIIENDLPKVL